MTRQGIVLTAGAAIVLVLGTVLVVTRCGRAPAESGGPVAASVDAGVIPGTRDRLATLRAASARLPPPTPTRLAGTVRDAATRKPISGAVVALAGTGDSDDDQPFVVSDPAGRFVIEGAAPGKLAVAAAAPGHTPAVVELILGSGEHREDLTLSLAPGGHAVSGRVTDVRGDPIAGVVVSATVPAVELTARVVALSDASGHYQLDLAGEGEHLLGATAEGYVKGERRLGGLEAAAVFDWVLTPAGQVSGRILSRDGRPVAEAFVTIRGGHATSASSEAASPITVRSAADGTFRIGTARPGALELSVRARGLATREPLLLELGIGEVVDDVEVFLDPARSIAGYVVAAEAPDQGLASAHVIAVIVAGGVPQMARTVSDAAGHFEIVGLREGTYTLYAGADGRQTPLPQMVKLGDEKVDDVVIELGKGFVVRGRVEPAPGATITLRGGIAQLSETAHSRPDGTFEVEGVSPGRYILEAIGDDGSGVELPVVVDKSDLQDLVVTLQPRAVLSGRVVDRSGAPVAEAAVRLAMGGQNEAHGTSNQNGRFVIRGLRPGTYVATVSMAHDYQPLDLEHGVTVTLAAGEKRNGVELQVESLQNVVRGRVVDGSGAPIAEAWVSARRENLQDERLRAVVGSDFGRAPPVLTGRDGAFSIKGLRAGSYAVTAEHEGAVARLEHATPGREVTLRLAEPARLDVTVLSAGKPVAAYGLKVSGPQLVMRKVDDASGRSKLPRLIPGHYVVDVRSRSGVATGTIDLAAGEHGELSLSLTPLATARGQLVDQQTRRPMAGFKLFAGCATAGNVLQLDEDSMAAMQAGKLPETDASGRFEVSGLAGGTCLVMAGRDLAAASDYSWSALVLAELAPGEAKDLGVTEGTLDPVVPPDQRGEIGLSFGEPSTAITSIVPGGAAARAGLKVGDVVRMVDQASSPGLILLLLSPARLRIGQTLHLRVERDGVSKTFTLTAAAPGKSKP